MSNFFTGRKQNPTKCYTPEFFQTSGFPASVNLYFASAKWQYHVQFYAIQYKILELLTPFPSQIFLLNKESDNNIMFSQLAIPMILIIFFYYTTDHSIIHNTIFKNAPYNYLSSLHRMSESTQPNQLSIKTQPTMGFSPIMN